MKQLSTLPHKVRLIQNQWISMNDGTRLSACIWLPDSAARQPVPAILEYIPYRKHNSIISDDEALSAYFAGQGYACIRVDMRGTGDSEGLFHQRDPSQQQQDGLEVLRWITQQPWCNQRVGMIGVSWSGVAALQLAARQPPELNAVMVAAVTLDRYPDDGGYFIGCLPGQTLGLGASMLIYGSRPPDPKGYGDGWRRLWLQRLQQTPLQLETWLQHQRCDAYWQAGAVRADCGRIECPVYVCGGWSDGWSNAVQTLMTHLGGKRKGVAGSWGHMYPHLALPGPGVAFPQEALRWWNHWLRDEDNGIMQEPMLHCYVQKHVPPQATHSMHAGQWLALERWPPAEAGHRRLYLSPHGLADEPVAAGLIRIRSPLSAGQLAGEYLPVYQNSEASQLPSDQRPDDAKSTIFDSAPFKQAVGFLGAPSVELELASDCASGLIAVRLCDVAPNGSSSLITLGILNLAQRKSKENPLPVEPGKRYRVKLSLKHVGYRILAGHRLRLALSTSCWPRAWPVPNFHSLDVRYNDSFLDLPVCPLPAADLTLPLFGEAEIMKSSSVTGLRPLNIERRVSQDLKTGLNHYDVLTDGGACRFERSGLVCESQQEEHYSIADDNPLSARAEYRHVCIYSRNDWQVTTKSRLVMTCTKDDFLLQAELDAFEKDKRVFSRNWDIKIPRDGF